MERAIYYATIATLVEKKEEKMINLIRKQEIEHLFKAMELDRSNFRRVPTSRRKMNYLLRFPF